MDDIRGIYAYYSFHGNAASFDGIALRQKVLMSDCGVMVDKPELIETAYARNCEKFQLLSHDGFLELLVYISIRLKPEMITGMP